MIELNGTTNGIAIMITYSNTKKCRFLTDKEKKTRLFNNFKVAKTVAHTITNIDKVEYYIILGDNQYPLSSAYKHGETYNLVDKETNEIIVVREKLEYRGSDFCYIVFENGDTRRCDKKYGYNRTNELFTAIAQSIEMAFVDNFDEYGIEYTDKYKGEFVIHLRGCSGAIHISTNSNLMDVNQYRKEDGEKVFPFSKDMDKFLTFYTYISRDTSEPLRFKSEEKCKKQLQRLIEHLQEMYPETEPKLVNINYKSFICFNE